MSMELLLHPDGKSRVKSHWAVLSILHVSPNTFHPRCSTYTQSRDDILCMLWSYATPITD